LHVPISALHEIGCGMQGMRSTDQDIVHYHPCSQADQRFSRHDSSDTAMFFLPESAV
jgi:hypothetical protein